MTKKPTSLVLYNENGAPGIVLDAACAGGPLIRLRGRAGQTIEIRTDGDGARINLLDEGEKTGIFLALSRGRSAVVVGSALGGPSAVIEQDGGQRRLSVTVREGFTPKSSPRQRRRKAGTPSK